MYHQLHVDQVSEYIYMFMYHYMHNFLDLVGLIHVKKITIKKSKFHCFAKHQYGSNIQVISKYTASVYFKSDLYELLYSPLLVQGR